MAVVVLYATPVSGTVAPTATQAVGNSLTCQVGMADADTTATITHNWGLTAANNTALYPWINWYLSTAGTAIPILSFALSTNTVTITKASAAGSGGTYNVVVQRPYSPNI